MPIVTLQRQFRELGRIRTGQQVPLGGNRKGTRPEKLETFRLTSADRPLLEHAAVIYGGVVEEWPGAPDGDAFQLTTEADALDIIVPPGRPITQWMEQWGSGGCLRRCDGEREWLANTPCQCPQDPEERMALAGKGEACKPTTRLQVILPRLPDLGTWLAVSHSYYAAVELAGTAELLAAAAAQTGRMLSAELYIDQRSVKRQGQVRKEFGVLAIRTPDTFLGLLSAVTTPAIVAGETRPALPEPTALPADPAFTPKAQGFAIPTDRVLPLTHAELWRLVKDAQVDLAFAESVFRREFPDAESTQTLTDEQRGALWKAMAEPLPPEAPSQQAWTDDEIAGALR